MNVFEERFANHVNNFDNIDNFSSPFCGSTQDKFDFQNYRNVEVYMVSESNANSPYSAIEYRT